MSIEACMYAEVVADEVTGERRWECREVDGRGFVSNHDMVELAAKTFAVGTELRIYEPGFFLQPQPGPAPAGLEGPGTSEAEKVEAARSAVIAACSRLERAIELDIASAAQFIAKVQADALLTIAVPIVEELSKRPQTQWGGIIVALREKAARVESAAPNTIDTGNRGMGREKWWEWGGYDGTSCSHCGRERVMITDAPDGTVHRVCEKCGWDQELGDYATTYSPSTPDTLGETK